MKSISSVLRLCPTEMSDSQTTYLYENRKPIRLAEVFQNFSSSGVALIGSDGTVLGSNGLFSELCGRPAHATAADLPEALRDAVSDFLAGPGTPVRVEVELAKNSGTKRMLQLELFQSSGPDASPITTVILNDLESVHALEAHIRRLDRLANIGTLSASAAHEIKNCLVTIKTFLDTVLEDSNDEQMTEMVKREMDRINRTTSQLLKYSGSPRSERVSRDVHELLQHSLRLVQHQFAEKRIELIENFQIGNSEISADGNLLEQAFLNLFLNAFDAVETGGRIRVTTRLVRENDLENGLSGTAVCVTVEDNGEGIAPENIPHLFRRFFTTKETGTGLGLAITQQIIKEHSGKITVESETGKGAKFSITLPLRQSP